jgi:hypothetical protein
MCFFEIFFAMLVWLCCIALFVKQWNVNRRIIKFIVNGCMGQWLFNFYSYVNGSVRRLRVYLSYVCLSALEIILNREFVYDFYLLCLHVLLSKDTKRQYLPKQKFRIPCKKWTLQFASSRHSFLTNKTVAPQPRSAIWLMLLTYRDCCRQ